MKTDLSMFGPARTETPTGKFQGYKHFTFSGPYNGDDTFDKLGHVLQVEIRDAIGEVLQRHGFTLEESGTGLTLLNHKEVLP